MMSIDSKLQVFVCLREIILLLELGYLLFGASETLSKSVQGKDANLQEALTAVNLSTKGIEQTNYIITYMLIRLTVLEMWV